MKRLWARVGMTVEMTDEEYDELLSLIKEDKEKASAKVSELFETRAYADGDFYLPYDADDNPDELCED